MKRSDDEMHYKGVKRTPPPQEHATDPLGPIVHRYLVSGDEEAMDLLVERTRPRLMAVARRIGDPQDAEDAVQGAYMALLRKRGDGLDAPVMPWLLTTVVRLAYRRKAKHGRQRDLAARLARPQERRDALPTADPAPDHRALEAERDLLLREEVARLPARYRDAVVLRHLEGLSTREAAGLLDVPEATLRTHLHRAAKLLRSRMAPTLLAILMFLPWCVADAARRLVPITREIAAWATPARTGGLLVATSLVAAVGAWAWLLDAPADAGGAATPPPAETGSAPRPAPGPDAGEPAPTVVERTEPTEGDMPDEEDAAARIPPRRAPERAPASPDDPAPAPERSGRTLPEPRLPVADIAAGDVELPEPPGMVFLEGGLLQLGTRRETLDTLLAGRPEPIRELFDHETPRHSTRVPSYWIGRYEVTNAQYLRFLQSTRITHTVRPGAIETLEALAARFLSEGSLGEGRDRPRDDGAWRQLYEGNRGAIWRAFAKAGRDILVLGPGGAVDLEATAERVRREPLPAGLELTAYRVRVPGHWPGMRPADDQLDHPVGYVSYADAERMAEWAGMHIPTEAEWEWAARGLEGRMFPWGEDWPADASRANWGAKITDARHMPATLPVDTLPAGRSWCGAHHMTGNVAEWTSSWFMPYPGSDVAEGKAEPHPYMGRWVKVIRGGSAADMESLVLRPAARNFVGGGPKAPPYVENRFRLVGFRLAAYKQPGRDHVGPMIRRAANGHLRTEALAPERFAGFVQRGWLPADATPANHVYVQGEATAVVFVPVTALLRDETSPRMAEAWRRAARLRSAAGLRDALDTESAFFVAGVLHLDLPLEGVAVPDTDAPAPRRDGPPATTPGRCEPGTYLVVLWHDRVALTTPSRELVCFLPERAPRVPSVEVRPRSSKRLGPPTLKPSLEADEGGLDFRIPLGGRRSPDAYVVHVRAALPYAKQAFHAATAKGAWLRSTDGR